MEKPDKSKVEAIPLGNFNLTISGQRSWLENDNANHLYKRMADICGAAVLKTRVKPNCLRLVAVVADFNKYVEEWQEELGMAVTGVTSGENGETFGKTLVWGDGTPETSYAIIVLPEMMAFALMADHQDARRIFVHELGHVEEQVSSIKEFGEDKPVGVSDFYGMTLVVSKSIYGEAYAEFVSYQFTPAVDLRQSFGFSRQLLVEARRIIADAIFWDPTQESIEFRQTVAYRLSGVFCQFGRSLGLLLAAKDKPGVDIQRLIGIINGYSADWGQLMLEMYEQLESIFLAGGPNQLNVGALQMLVKKGFDLIGAYPDD